MSNQDENSKWPLPKFYFQVSWGKNNINFMEVSGLESESQQVEYRHGNSPSFFAIKMPGLGKVGNVVLKRGTFDGNQFPEWLSPKNMSMGSIKTETVVISLLDEKDQPAMTWKLTNAYPIKLTATDMNSNASEVAIESLELGYDTITIENKD